MAAAVEFSYDGLKYRRFPLSPELCLLQGEEIEFHSFGDDVNDDDDEAEESFNNDIRE